VLPCERDGGVDGSVPGKRHQFNQIRLAVGHRRRSNLPKNHRIIQRGNRHIELVRNSFHYNRRSSRADRNKRECPKGAETKQRRNNKHAVSQIFDQEPEEHRSNSLRKAGGRAQQSKPVAVVGGPEYREKEWKAQALAALAALGQATRLAIFRGLVRMEPNGMSAGTVAETVGCPHNTLSTHVGILARAGLVTGTREGRTITYRADAAGTRALFAFLANDCCDGRPELCGLPGEADADCDCAPASSTKNRR
jgi:ArsR family transcriptional regulator